MTALIAVMAAGAAVAALVGCAMQPAAPPRDSGLKLADFDRSTRPQDDFYRHVNGHWLDTTEIPADRPSFGGFAKLRDDTLREVRTLVEPLAQTPATPGSEARKIGDLYASFMDEARIESLGLAPLAPEFARIDALADAGGFAEVVAHLQRIGAGGPFDAGVHQDNRDSTRYVFDLVQSGLGMPDRDYYLADDEKLRAIRAQYATHVERMLALAGIGDPAAAARGIVELETRIARAHWTKVKNRDAVKRYNKVPVATLATLAPGFDWPRWLAAAGVGGRVDDVIVSQPSYLAEFGRIAASTPLPAWKAYLKWRVLSDAAPLLGAAFVDEHFAFYGTALAGTPQNRPRWERAVLAVQGALGQALGRLYVDRYFPPQSKARMDALVRNLLDAYRRSIDTLAWMGPQTRQAAQLKLSKLATKIGYPEVWRDYGPLEIVRGDLVGDMQRAAAFETDYDLAKLGRPVDRREWFATPQTVNAFYNPEENSITFPAAILQPPFFNVAADDAVNYGAIGAVIGHEISHAFDDQGSRYDGDGNLHDWFTADDHAAFAALTGRLVRLYSHYEGLPGYPVNGELTLGENIADNSGLEIALKAYHLALHGRAGPVLDDLTADQRFFVGFCQVWQVKMREALRLQLIKVDRHSPNPVRCNAVASNQDAFYDAWQVKPGDRMYLAPAERVSIW